MSASQIQDRIWELRSEQANCTVAERAAIQREIERLYAMLDRLTK